MNKKDNLSAGTSLPDSNKEMIKHHGLKVCEPNNLNVPIKKFNLQGNQFCGNILVGNYSYLTQLEVTENEVDVLDLSSLIQLESLKCTQNKMTEVIVNGTNLTSIEAVYSELKKINIVPVPIRLKNLNISHNYLTELPSWIYNCSSLLTLQAGHNELKTINKYQVKCNLESLRVLHLGFNHLRNIDGILDNSSQIEKIYLQSNEIVELPQKLFNFIGSHLTELNVSCNRLSIFPKNTTKNLCHLEKIFATSNHLNNSFFEILLNSHELRVLHAAYNKLTLIPEKNVSNWPNLEELVLSGNHLQQLPTNLSLLTKLKVLRLHSNLLLSIPILSNLRSLRVLDLAHNHLDKIDLQSIVSKSLKYLDLSCNIQLQVDNNQVVEFQSQRNWSLVDVSGNNRLSLPTKHEKIKESSLNSPPWKFGFSETTGVRANLCVSQIRLPLFKPNEGLFGMFESENSSKIPKMWVKVIPKMFVQEKTIKDTIGEYIKYAQLSAHYKISDDGLKYGFSAALCHIAKQKFTTNGQRRHFKGKKFTLCVASLGSITAFLIRKTSIVSLTLGGKEISLQSKANILPEPLINEIALENDDEYLVICNEEVSKVMDMERIAREIRKDNDVILSSKRIQDVAQSFGANLNISTIVVKFRNIGTDVNSLINELKQTVHKKSMNENICWSGDRQDLFYRQMLVKSDRPLPSMQCKRNYDNISAHSLIPEENNGQEYFDETDSALSGEQYKCWEYILEQNTQLLFDKELNTISKSFSKKNNLEKKRNSECSEPESDPQLKKASKNKLLSISSPQLIYNDYGKNQSVAYQSSFFSKNFRGSSSQAGPLCTDFLPTSKASGLPNSAYFGSLKRLMPYNLETNFAVMTERPFLDDDYAEHEDRMGQYWAIASTEL